LDECKINGISSRESHGATKCQNMNNKSDSIDTYFIKYEQEGEFSPQPDLTATVILLLVLRIIPLTRLNRHSNGLAIAPRLIFIPLAFYLFLIDS
jgi:hypothetical protein